MQDVKTVGGNADKDIGRQIGQHIFAAAGEDERAAGAGCGAAQVPGDGAGGGVIERGAAFIGEDVLLFAQEGAGKASAPFLPVGKECCRAKQGGQIG